MIGNAALCQSSAQSPKNLVVSRGGEFIQSADEPLRQTTKSQGTHSPARTLSTTRHGHYDASHDWHVLSRVEACVMRPQARQGECQPGALARTCEQMPCGAVVPWTIMLCTCFTAAPVRQEVIYLPPIKEGPRRSGMRCRCDMRFGASQLPCLSTVERLLRYASRSGTHRQVWMVIRQEGQ